MSEDPLIRRPTPATSPFDVVCAACKRTILAGRPLYPTRGLMRHNGKWLGDCCV